MEVEKRVRNSDLEKKKTARKSPGSSSAQSKTGTCSSEEGAEGGVDFGWRRIVTTRELKKKPKDWT